MIVHEIIWSNCKVSVVPNQEVNSHGSDLGLGVDGDGEGNFIGERDGAWDVNLIMIYRSGSEPIIEGLAGDTIGKSNVIPECDGCCEGTSATACIDGGCYFNQVLLAASKIIVWN